MNLIDILGQILNVKNEIRDIIEENNDLSRYPTAMNNWLVDRYNEGYTVGYKTKRLALDGTTVTPDPPLNYHSFDDYIPDTYYTSYDYDTLVDIMSWVLNVRKLMKDEDILDTTSDFFPEYPAMLRAMYQEIYDKGVQDGEDAATSDVYPDVEVHTPTLNYTPNTFTLTTDQPEATIWYKLGETGAVNKYTRQQTITESTDIYYWCKIGTTPSSTLSQHLTYDASVTPPADVVLPSMCEIRQRENTNEITISCDTPGAQIIYSIKEQGVYVEQNKPYTGSILFVKNDNTEIEAYAQNENGQGPKNSYRAYYHANGGGGGQTDPTKVATPVISWGNPTFSITCLTSGATIEYSYNRNDWTVYSNPVTLTGTMTVYARARKTGMEDSTVTSMYCSFDSNPSNKVSTPQISLTNNIATITCSTSGATIWWSRDNVAFVQYDSPISISDNTYIYAYAAKDGMENSNKASQYCEYSSPYVPLYCLPVICNVVTLENLVTLSCDTNGATIHYKIMTSGSYSTVASPYSFTLDGQYDIYEIYCYATKSGYNDSEMRCYTIPYYRVVHKPAKPVINLSDDGTVTIYTVSTDATLYYKYGINGEWQTKAKDVGGRHENQITIQPTGDCAIYAKCTLDGVDSDEAGPLNYTWLSDTYDLEPPVVTRVGDRVYMQADNTIWYTINGGDPRTGGRTWNRTIPIYITEAGTVIKACCVDSVNGKTHYSEVVTKVWSPVEINDDDPAAVAGTHFWVKGASQITVNTNGYTGTTFAWSYDKMTWNSVNSSATGIDSSRTVYLQGSNGGRAIWDHMHFGATDSVTIGGNIMSLLYGNYFDDKDAVIQESTFREMFSGATTLVDASAVSIPVTNTMGHDFQEMFKGCTLLRAAPKLNVKVLSADSCYEMFAGCTNLMSAPEMNITSVGPRACQRMFADCTNMIQAGTFNITALTGQYSYDIHHCEEMFKNCTNLETCNMTIGAVKENAFTSCFENCTSLKNGVSITCETTAKNCYKNMFKNCTSLKLFGNLPASAIAASAYESMFEGCASLTGIGHMNATSVTYTRALARMFAGCTSLTTSPVIKIKSLNQSACLEGMFQGCSSLNFITALFLTDPLGSGSYPWTYNWVQGVAPMGTFVQAEDATWTRLGDHAIPTSWIIRNYNNNSVGTITAIDLNGNQVTIVASNADAIYYQINSTSESGWQLYTGPFDIASSCTMNARCKNSEGTWGEIKTETLTIGEYPLKFVNSSNSISISYNPAANYRSVTYRILDSHGNQIQGWTNYDGPFDAFAAWAENYSTGDSLDITIEAKASKVNGDPTSVYTFDTTLGIEPPRAWVDGLVAKMSTETPGAVIEYYENGEWKTWTDRVIYGVTEFTVRCKLPTNDGDMYSEEKTVELRPNQVDVPEPVVSWYDRENNILQITAAEGCTISYNLAYDGVYSGYRTYDGPFEITATCDVKAIATDAYGQESDEVEYRFVYNNAGGGDGGEDIPVVFTPIIAFNDPVVTITCLTDGATIYYSYDSNTWLPYSSPVTLTTTTTVYAKAEKSGMYPSNVASLYCEVDGGQTDTVATPEISFDNTTNTVTIICATSDASIYYSYDNNMWDLYVGSIILSQSEYIYAKATKVGLEDSSVASLYCEVDGGQTEKVATPVIVWNEPVVTITCATSGATIWYSYNNTTWGRYNGPITLSESQTVYANATTDGMEESDTASYYCEISGEEPTGTVDTPVINWNSPTFTITCATGGATIHYSYDKNNWITYNGGVTLNDSATVYAYASKTGMDDSGITQRYCLIGSSGYESEYLTFTVNGPSGDSNYVGIRPRIFNNATIYASVNGGEFEVWSKNTKITLHSGDYVKVYSANALWGAGDSNHFEFSSSSYPSRNHIVVSGNIMSMVSPSMGTAVPATNNGYFTNFFRNRVDSGGYSIIDDNDIITDASNLVLAATTLATDCYSCMFKGCTSLTAAPALPALTMVSGCYGSMFSKCTSLTTAPALPATTLAISCYAYMFEDCTALVTVPASIPAAVAAYGCCEGMFQGCTSLVNAPELPATSMSGSYCYAYMFEGCTSLVNGPSTLPATTLKTTCYAQMFAGCTSLTTAPILPASTLKTNCYKQMFQGCSSLTYIKCLATNVSSIYYTEDWVDGVQSGGTFVKNTGSVWPTGKNGIPNGWTVQEAAA